jgi:hypothetical protein
MASILRICIIKERKSGKGEMISENVNTEMMVRATRVLLNFPLFVTYSGCVVRRVDHMTCSSTTVSSKVSS